MLINIRISELQSNTSNSILLAIAVAISFNYPVFLLLPYYITIVNNYYNLNHILLNISNNLNNNKIKLNLYNDDIYFVTSKIWDGNLIENSHITSIGNLLYTNYNIWLILASFILLLAMVGSIVITIKPNSSKL
jgi:NADH-ubiquinone oxidoreductase chain 6